MIGGVLLQPFTDVRFWKSGRTVVSVGSGSKGKADLGQCRFPRQKRRARGNCRGLRIDVSKVVALEFQDDVAVVPNAAEQRHVLV